MVTRRDLRPVILRNTLEHPDLGNAERLFLVVVVHLATEFVDGQRRSGSQGMDATGRFALHYDYLARALHTSPANAKKQAQRLEAKGFLSKRWPGTFGRPAGYQALDVRGDNTYRITFRDFVPPYGVDTPSVRGDVVSPLPYRTPDHGDHPPTSGVPRTARIDAESSNEQDGCRYHGWATCPADCADHPGDRRRSA